MTTATPSDIEPLKELSIPVPDPIRETEVDEKCINIDKNGTADICKRGNSGCIATPDRIQVPKPFKYPERYTSPTDHMMSPISKGLLARGRRGGALLPPSKTHSKIRELHGPDVDVVKIQL